MQESDAAILYAKNLIRAESAQWKDRKGNLVLWTVHIILIAQCARQIAKKS